MAQYIDKNKVEEILRNLWKQDDGHNSEHRICYNKALQEVQCEVDTIETKEVDLEHEVESYWKKYNMTWCRDACSMTHIRTMLSDVAKHFFELGLKTRKD